MSSATTQPAAPVQKLDNGSQHSHCLREDGGCEDKHQCNIQNKINKDMKEKKGNSVYLFSWVERFSRVFPMLQL